MSTMDEVAEQLTIFHGLLVQRFELHFVFCSIFYCGCLVLCDAGRTLPCDQAFEEWRCPNCYVCCHQRRTQETYNINSITRDFWSFLAFGGEFE